MGLQHVTEEECHQAREYLIFLSPRPCSGSLQSKHSEGILSTDNQGNGKKFEVGKEISEIFVDGCGRVIFPFYADVRVQLADRPGVLLEHLAIPSGDAKLEFQHWPSVEGLLAEPLWVGIPQTISPHIQAVRGLRWVLSHHGPPDVNVFYSDNCEQQKRRQDTRLAILCHLKRGLGDQRPASQPSLSTGKLLYT